MKKSWRFFPVMVLVIAAAGCAQKPPAVTLAANGNRQVSEQQVPRQQLSERQAVSAVFVESSNGTDDGVKRLIRSMQAYGIEFYQTAANPKGLFASGDVVLLEINCQWAERGGTNTDLILNVIQALVEHPDGWNGEIIIADNGQAQYGSRGRGGSLSWENTNSADRKQSVMDVVRYFKARDRRVTGVLWDEFTTVKVSEFSADDNTNGFVVEDTRRSTGAEVSYPKFTTEYGTGVSFKQGIWNAASRTYDNEKLKMINMPVLKSHALFQVTGAVKSYMGTTSERLTGSRTHNNVGRGSMGSQMAGTRMPTLNIMDMIWIGPDRGPGISYAAAREINKIAASVDPVAIDYWASKYVLMPEAAKVSANRSASMNPDATEPGTFGYWLRLSMNELHKAGIWATMDESEIVVIQG